MLVQGLRPAAVAAALLVLVAACTGTVALPGGPVASSSPSAVPESSDDGTAPGTESDGAVGRDDPVASSSPEGVLGDPARAAVVTGRYPIALGAEISGIAAGREVAGLWLVDDERGTDLVHLVALDGSLLASVRLLDVRTVNIEDLAVGPCTVADPDEAPGSCVHVADIGDNVAERGDVTVISFPESAVADTTDASTVAVTPVVRRLVYDTGPVDAEALVVAPDGTVVVVDKTPEEAGVHVAAPDGSVLRRTATLPLPEPRNRMLAQMVGHTATAADLSADGGLLALRTYDQVALLRPPDGGDALGAGGAASDLPTWVVEDLGRVSGELQGEAVALLADGRVATIAEGSTAITVTTPPGAG